MIPATPQTPIVDIVTVCFNDQKFFPAYLDSILSQTDVDLSHVNLIMVDNNSSKENYDVLLQHTTQAQQSLRSYQVIRENVNQGFAKGCNIGAFNSQSDGDFLFFLNSDTELHPRALANLFKHFSRDEASYAAWEFRQFPYEHPKIYDPLTGEVSWGSGAALVIRREVFKRLKGFDTRLFMYTEDVDISWRIRMEGFKIKYLPECIVYHYSYQSFNQTKPIQYFYSIFNNLQLRFKFGTMAEIKNGFRLLKMVLKNKGPFENSRKLLLNHKARRLHKFVQQRMWYFRFKKIIRRSSPQKFLDFDYEQRREGAFYFNELPKSSPLVSVIIRTVNRPLVLREALISLRNQTYKNLEVIVVEDGLPLSERYVARDFKDLNVRYFSTRKKVGRTKAGNLGLKMATGQYFNFLDDDDMLYADHFECLVRQSERHPEFKIFNNFAFEAKTTTISKEPYVYRFEDLTTVHRKRFNLIRLTLHNFLPIQTVMFHREVFESLGGFDESLDVLEDWDLWIRFASKYEFYTVFKTCSLYKVPAENDLAHTRRMQFDNALKAVQKKQLAYQISLDPIRLSTLHKNFDK